jgi:uncharacterized cupin superfamily protein
MAVQDHSPQAWAGAFGDARLTDWAVTVDPAHEPRPHAQGAVVWRSSDGTAVAGFWECTPGRFSRTYPWTETAVFLSGLAVVEVGGVDHRLSSGALLVLPVGVTATWTVVEHVRKAFHLNAVTHHFRSDPCGPPKRATDLKLPL